MNASENQTLHVTPLQDAAGITRVPLDGDKRDVSSDADRFAALLRGTAEGPGVAQLADDKPAPPARGRIEAAAGQPAQGATASAEATLATAPRVEPRVEPREAPGDNAGKEQIEGSRAPRGAIATTTSHVAEVPDEKFAASSAAPSPPPTHASPATPATPASSATPAAPATRATAAERATPATPATAATPATPATRASPASPAASDSFAGTPSPAKNRGASDVQTQTVADSRPREAGPAQTSGPAPALAQGQPDDTGMPLAPRPLPRQLVTPSGVSGAAAAMHTPTHTLAHTHGPITAASAPQSNSAARTQGAADAAPATPPLSAPPSAGQGAPSVAPAMLPVHHMALDPVRYRAYLQRRKTLGLDSNRTGVQRKGFMTATTSSGASKEIGKRDAVTAASAPAAVAIGSAAVPAAAATSTAPPAPRPPASAAAPPLAAVSPVTRPSPAPSPTSTSTAESTAPTATEQSAQGNNGFGSARDFRAPAAAPEIPPVETVGVALSSGAPFIVDIEATGMPSDMPQATWAKSADVVAAEVARVESEAPIEGSPADAEGAPPRPVQQAHEERATEAIVSEIAAQQVQLVIANTPESLPLEVLKSL